MDRENKAASVLQEACTRTHFCACSGVLWSQGGGEGKGQAAFAHGRFLQGRDPMPSCHF